MGTAAAPPKRYVWDEFDDGEEANYQPPARRRSRASAKYAWDDEEAPALADGDASFEAARAQTADLRDEMLELDYEFEQQTAQIKLEYDQIFDEKLRRAEAAGPSPTRG